MKQQKDMGVNYHKGMPQKDHWQIDVSKSAFPEGDVWGMNVWNPLPGKDRAVPHKKINECDH